MVIEPQNRLVLPGSRGLWNFSSLKILISHLYLSRYSYLNSLKFIKILVPSMAVPREVRKFDMSSIYTLLNIDLRYILDKLRLLGVYAMEHGRLFKSHFIPRKCPLYQRRKFQSIHCCYCSHFTLADMGVVIDFNTSVLICSQVVDREGRWKFSCIISFEL